jgi:type II secretion system protein F
MPQYRYEVKKGPGKSITGVLEAENQRSAVTRLRDMGYFPISVEETSGAEADGGARRSRRRVRLKDRNVFFRQLANLMESGMPITRALMTLEEQTENPRLRSIVEQLRQDVQKGATFAEALERHPKVFPAMHCNLVRAGESGGMLEDVLWRIVTFGEQEEELRGKATSAMVYPAFLMLVGSVAIFILVSFVFPKFITMFEDMNAPMPWPTVVVMGLCGFMGSFWWAVLAGLAAGAAALVSYLRTPVGRRQLHGLLLRVPVTGRLVQRYEMARFARTLGTLLDNGVPILTALRITRETVGNVLIADEVGEVQARVTEGDGISDSLRACRHFPPMVVNMFAVGEESGRLGAVANRIAEAYDNEVDRAVKALTALLEPTMIVVMGVIVGFLVIAMLLPILTLSQTVG